MTRLKSLKRFGHRLFAGINRVGGSESVQGSFLWVMKTGIDLLEGRELSKLATTDTDDIVQWWFYAAFTEAGRLLRGEVKPDTDYSKILSDVFLLDFPGGCMRSLKEKVESRETWTKMAANLPFTVQAVMSGAVSSNVSSVSSGSASALSSVARLRTPFLQVPTQSAKRKIGGVS